MPLHQPPIETSRKPDAWAFERPEPTDLLALSPHDREPTPTEIIAAFETVLNGPVIQLGEPANIENAQWARALQLPDVEIPVIVWAEKMRPLPEETIKFLKAESIKWVIGLETLLDPHDAAGHFMTLLRMLGRAIPDSPAILNVNNEGWHTRQELDDVLLPADAEISPQVLWLVHAIGAQTEAGQRDEDARLWVYTVGLARAGLPELEMHEVPVPHGRAAAAMLNSLAELLLESGMPAPGEAYEIGDDLAVAFHPWRDAARHVPDTIAGSLALRKDHKGDELLGVRAAVCAVGRDGNGKLVWPAEVVEKIHSGKAAMYKTHEATQREARLARKTFGEFTAAFASLPSHQRSIDDRKAIFLLKAGFAVPAQSKANEAENREHLWFEVLKFKNGRALGRLLNEPHAIRHLRKSDEAWIDRGIVSDWQVISQRGMFGPASLSALRETLQELAGSPAHASP